MKKERERDKRQDQRFKSLEHQCLLIIRWDEQKGQKQRVLVSNISFLKKKNEEKKN
jgi:hypothetical protein